MVDAPGGDVTIPVVWGVALMALIGSVVVASVAFRDKRRRRLPKPRRTRSRFRRRRGRATALRSFLAAGGASVSCVAPAFARARAACAPGVPVALSLPRRPLPPGCGAPSLPSQERRRAASRCGPVSVASRRLPARSLPLRGVECARSPEPGEGRGDGPWRSPGRHEPGRGPRGGRGAAVPALLRHRRATPPALLSTGSEASHCLAWLVTPLSINRVRQIRDGAATAACPAQVMTVVSVTPTSCGLTSTQPSSCLRNQ